jgi:hypothetical protein
MAQISEIQNDEPIVIRMETVRFGGEYQHTITRGSFYTERQSAEVYGILREHESIIKGDSMKITTQLNSCGVKRTLTEVLN